MINIIPGTEPEEGREFFYIEVRPGEGFREAIDDALSLCPDVPMPKDGGVIEEKARIILESGQRRLGISYRGDVEGWKAKLIAYCHEKERLCGIVKGGVLAFSNGNELQLAECNVVFEPMIRRK